MAVITKTIYQCDLCGADFATDAPLKNYPVLVRHYMDDTEGRPCTPYITAEKMDLCTYCADAVCNVDVGFRGSNLELRRVEHGL